MGGTVRVWVLIDTTGTVTNVRVDQSSGHVELDRAASRVAGTFRFTPALSGDRKIEAWVAFPVSFQLRAVEEAPPATVGARPDPADGPVFTPFTEAPNLINREEVVAALEREYPPMLRDAGVVGTVAVWVFIDESGIATDVRVKDSSGQPALDDAALRVARVFRFSPARNGDQVVPVWVSLPIRFAVH